MNFALAAACLTLTGILTASEWGLSSGGAWARPTQILSKTLASLCFIAFGLSIGVLHIGAAGPPVFAALLLSAVGDVAMLSRRNRPFLLGLIAFLLAHVGYVVGFAALSVRPWACAAAAVPLLVNAYVVWRWLGPRAGKLRRPVVAYILVITTMVAFHSVNGLRTVMRSSITWPSWKSSE